MFVVLYLILDRTGVRLFWHFDAPLRGKKNAKSVVANRNSSRFHSSSQDFNWNFALLTILMQREERQGPHTFKLLRMQFSPTQRIEMFPQLSSWHFVCVLLLVCSGSEFVNMMHFVLNFALFSWCGPDFINCKVLLWQQKRLSRDFWSRVRDVIYKPWKSKVATLRIPDEWIRQFGVRISYILYYSLSQRIRD